MLLVTGRRSIVFGAFSVSMTASHLSLTTQLFLPYSKPESIETVFYCLIPGQQVSVAGNKSKAEANGTKYQHHCFPTIDRSGMIASGQYQRKPCSCLICPRRSRSGPGRVGDL